MLVLVLSKYKLNAIILVMYKFSKQVTLMDSADTWLVEQLAHIFLKMLDLMD